MVFIKLTNLILISLTKIYVKWEGVLVSKSKVYFTKEITPEALVKIYEALNTELKDKVAVKI